jgi:hypothetical protein
MLPICADMGIRLHSVLCAGRAGSAASGARRSIGRASMSDGPVVGCPKVGNRQLGSTRPSGRDALFEQLVTARIIEPTSKQDVARVLAEPGAGQAR